MDDTPEPQTREEVERDWEDWTEEEGEEEEGREREPQCPCPICDSGQSGGASETLAHVASSHGVDLARLRREWRLDDYGWIKLVNWLRKLRPRPAQTAQWPSIGVDSPRHALFADDANLMPAIQDDPLLSLLSDDEDGGGIAVADCPSSMAAALAEENSSLKETVRKMLLEGSSVPGDDAGEDCQAPDEEERVSRAVGEAVDHAFTNAFAEWARRAAKARLLPSDPLVVVVGAGAGAVTAAVAKEAGAGRVVAIEQAGAAAAIARATAEENSVARLVTVIRGGVTSDDARQTVGGPGKAAVIIAQCWDPLVPSSLHAALRAREMWLQEDGGVFVPSRASLFVSAVESATRHAARSAPFEAGTRACGISLSRAKEAWFSEASREDVDPGNVVAGPCKLADVDASKVAREALSEVEFPFKMMMAREAVVHALCLHFDLGFGLSGDSADFLSLSTAADQPATHFKQLCLFLVEPVPCPAGAVLAGTLRLISSSKAPTHVDIQLSMQPPGGRAINTTFYF